MPVHGITDRVRLPRLGKIRLGTKEKGRRGEYPKKSPYFVLHDAQAVEAIYGDKATHIFPVLVPFDPPGRDSEGRWIFDSFWWTGRAAWGKSGKFCATDERRSMPDEDGVERYVAVRGHKGKLDRDMKGRKAGEPADPQGWAYLEQTGKLEDIEVGELFDFPCPGDECEYYRQGFCKQIGSLDIVLPNVPGRGIWTVQSSGYHSIVGIESSLQSVANDTGGVIRGIPFGLGLVAKEVAPRGRRTVIYALELVTPLSLRQLAAYRKKLLESGGATVALLMPSDEMPDEQMPFDGVALDEKLGIEPDAPIRGVDDADSAGDDTEIPPYMRVDLTVQETDDIVAAALGIDEPPPDPERERHDRKVAKAAAEGLERAKKAKPKGRPKRPAAVDF